MNDMMSIPYLLEIRQEDIKKANALRAAADKPAPGGPGPIIERCPAACALVRQTGKAGSVAGYGYLRIGPPEHDGMRFQCSVALAEFMSAWDAREDVEPADFALWQDTRR